MLVSSPRDSSLTTRRRQRNYWHPSVWTNPSTDLVIPRWIKWLHHKYKIVALLCSLNPKQNVLVKTMSWQMWTFRYSSRLDCWELWRRWEMRNWWSWSQWLRLSAEVSSWGQSLSRWWREGGFMTLLLSHAYSSLCPHWLHGAVVTFCHCGGFEVQCRDKMCVTRIVLFYWWNNIFLLFLSPGRQFTAIQYNIRSFMNVKTWPWMKLYFRDQASAEECRVWERDGPTWKRTSKRPKRS